MARKSHRFRFDRIIDEYGIDRAYYLTVRIGGRLYTIWGMWTGKRVRAGYYRIFVGPAWRNGSDPNGFDPSKEWGDYDTCEQ